MMRKAHGWGIITMATVVGLVGCSGGGGSTASHPLGDAGIAAVDVVARAGSFQAPVDAAPAPDGSIVYFIATGPKGPVVLRGPSAGDASSTVAQGAPLAQPTGVGVATDASHLYIADQQAAGAGAILTVPAAGTGQTPTVLPGTEGWAPRGIDVVNQGDTDLLYFTGTDPANAKPGLFQVSTTGGTVTTIAEGAPLTSPDSVVVSAEGIAYLTDQGTGTGQGQVFRVRGGTVTPVLTALHLGVPAGVTLIDGEAVLLVSSLDPATSSDQVLFLDLATGKTAAATKVVGANKGSSGGLHRAHGAKVLGWADTQGTVYRIRFP